MEYKGEQKKIDSVGQKIKMAASVECWRWWCWWQWFNKNCRGERKKRGRKRTIFLKKGDQLAHLPLPPSSSIAMPSSAAALLLLSQDLTGFFNVIAGKKGKKGNFFWGVNVYMCECGYAYYYYYIVHMYVFT